MASDRIAVGDAETIPRPEQRRVLTIDQEIEARELAQRIEETKTQDRAEYDKVLFDTVRGDREVANAAFQLVDDDTAEDMLRHVQELRDGQERDAQTEPLAAHDPAEQREPDPGPVDGGKEKPPMSKRDDDGDLAKDRGDVLDDRAEELHRKSLQAMRDGLSEIDDPAKLAMARKLIERMEETGKQFREGRAADDRDSPDARNDEATKARDADTERQTREAATRAASHTAADRAAMDRQVATDATTRDRTAREDARIEREIDREDDFDR